MKSDVPVHWFMSYLKFPPTSDLKTNPFAVLVVAATAERPHRGPKVGGHVTKQQFGTYVPRPVTDDQQMVPQQVVYQPQPIQYVQQPLQYTPQPIQYRPVQYVPQYQYQPQQPIQYQPQPVQYVPAVQKFIPIKKMDEPETLPEPEIKKHKIMEPELLEDSIIKPEQMKPEQFASEEIDSELKEKYTSAKDEQLIASVLRS